MLVIARKGSEDMAPLEDGSRIISIRADGYDLAAWIARITDLNRPEYRLFGRDAERGVTRLDPNRLLARKDMSSDAVRLQVGGDRHPGV